MIAEKQPSVLRSAVGCLSAISLIGELRNRDVRVVGVDCNPLSAGFSFCDKHYVVPRGDEAGFLEEILKICDIEKPNAILPGPEEEIIVLSKNSELFRDRGISVLCPDYETVRICYDKLATHEVLRSYGISTPKIYTEDNVTFPCIIKPRSGRGATGIFKAENKHELGFYIKKAKQPIIQEFIDGVEYSIDVLADLEAKPLSIVPRIRLQVESGISVKSQTVYDEEIINYCDNITRKLKLKGPSCIQCIKNDRKVVFTDINPRFGGGSILAVKADPSIVDNLIRIIQGNITVVSHQFTRKLTMLRYYSEVFVTQE